MKLNRELMASEPLILAGFKLPKSMLAAIDRVAARADCGVPNRSQVVREILFKALSKEAA